MRMSVIGTGYLGATHAACMAELGHEVVGVDTDSEKISRLGQGDLPFYEPGLSELLRKHVRSGQLRFTTDLNEAAEFASLHFIGVGTPQRSDGYGADTSFVESAFLDLAALCSEGSVLVGKSTVPVGTAADLQRKVDAAGSPNRNIEVIWNPEFLREGFAVKDTLQPDRIVVGVAQDRTAGLSLLKDAYEPILSSPDPCPVIVTDLPTAELVKVSANAFLATKISFINAVAEVCEATDADVTVLADAIGIDDRIGRKFLGAGLGFGGGCLPKDIRAFIARAGELGVGQSLTFLSEVDSINTRRRQRMIDLAIQACGGSLDGKTVTVLGAAFKPNSDDVRDSPALDVAGMLSLKGAHVVVYDPKALDNARRVFPTLNYADSALEACVGADVVIVATEWNEFRELDPSALTAVVRERVILDGRNCLETDRWVAAGWNLHALGRGRAFGPSSTD